MGKEIEKDKVVIIDDPMTSVPLNQRQHWTAPAFIFGGLEMMMAVGGMLRAAELRMVILVDGFIMTNCILAASRLCPDVLSYAVFGHQGDESGHKLLLDYLHAHPLLNLSLRLGEGSGSVCAFPILDSAVRMLNEMDNFAHASITKYF